MINNNLKRVKPVFLNIFWEYCQQNTLEVKLRIMKVNRNMFAQNNRLAVVCNQRKQGAEKYEAVDSVCCELVSDMERTTCKQKVDGYIKKLQSEMQSPQSRSAPNIDRKAQQEMWESGLLGPCMVILSISPQNSIKRSAKKCVTQ